MNEKRLKREKKNSEEYEKDKNVAKEQISGKSNKRTQKKKKKR